VQREEIEIYLHDFGEELTRRGFQGPINVMIVGGVHMVLHLANRPSTEDIDFRFLDGKLDLTRLPLSKDEKAFRAAISAVAKQHHLPRHWINNDAGPFIAEYVPNPTRVFWRAFGPLQVYFTDNATMLIYKLMGFSPKQMPDIYALAESLNIETSEEVKALVDRLVDPKVQKEYCVEETIEDLFE
jgi:hypothetical protein